MKGQPSEIQLTELSVQVRNEVDFQTAKVEVLEVLIAKFSSLPLIFQCPIQQIQHFYHYMDYME
jgi:hypothetical protein